MGQAVQVRLTVCLVTIFDIHYLQDFHALCSYLASQQASSFLCFMADFHLLFFLYTCDVAGIHLKVSFVGSAVDHSFPPQPHLPSLCRAIIEGDKAGADAWQRGDLWSTIEQLIAATNSSPNHTSSTAAAGGQWSCRQCTLLNSAHSVMCDACQFPRSSA